MQLSREKNFLMIVGGLFMVDINTLSQEERRIVEARREYKRKWRAANKEKVQQHNKRFYEKIAEEGNYDKH